MTFNREILIFADETYPGGTQAGSILFVALAVQADELERRRPAIRRLAGTRKKRLTPELKDFLNDPAFLLAIVTIDRMKVYGITLTSIQIAEGLVEQTIFGHKLWAMQLPMLFV